jgi:hypothetical protein
VAGFENLLHIGQDFQAEGTELGTPVVDGGRADGAQDAVRYGRGARNLQKVAACGVEIGGQHGLKGWELEVDFLYSKYIRQEYSF